MSRVGQANELLHSIGDHPIITYREETRMRILRRQRVYMWIVAGVRISIATTNLTDARRRLKRIIRAYNLKGK